MLKGAVNEAMGIPSGSRRKPKADELERAFAELDTIGDQVRDRIRTAIEEKCDG